MVRLAHSGGRNSGGTALQRTSSSACQGQGPSPGPEVLCPPEPHQHRPCGRCSVNVSPTLCTPHAGWLVSNQHMKAVASSQQSWEIRKEKSNALKNVNSGVSLPVFKITVYILPPSTKDLKQLMSISTNSRALTRH